jgi:hypothetical protein
MAVGLLQAADRHAAGAPADDDVTLVLIKRVDGMPGARDTPSAVTELSHDMR